MRVDQESKDKENERGEGRGIKRINLDDISLDEYVNSLSEMERRNAQDMIRYGVHPIPRVKIYMS